MKLTLPKVNDGWTFLPNQQIPMDYWIIRKIDNYCTMNLFHDNFHYDHVRNSSMFRLFTEGYRRV